MDGSSSQENGNYPNGRLNGNLKPAHSHTTIHPSLQGYVRSSTITRVAKTPLEQTLSVSEPHLLAGNSLDRKLKPAQSARSSLEINQTRQDSPNAPRVPIKPARTVNVTPPDASKRDILYPLRENVTNLSPKPSILKLPGSKTLGKKTVSVNTGQSTIVHVREPIQSRYESVVPSPLTKAPDFDQLDSDSLTSQSSSKVYSTVIPLDDIAWDGTDMPDDDSILSRGTSNGSVLSYDNQNDDTDSSYLSYQTVVDKNTGSSSPHGQPMVSSIFLPPERSNTEPQKRTERNIKVRSSRDGNQSRLSNLELSSSTYRSTDGVFTIAISDTDDSSVLTSSDKGKTVGFRDIIQSQRIGNGGDRNVGTSVTPSTSSSQRTVGSRDATVPSLLRPPGSRGIPQSTSQRGNYVSSSESSVQGRGILSQPHTRQPGDVASPSRATRRSITTSSSSAMPRGRGRGILTSSRTHSVSPSSYQAQVLHNDVQQPIQSRTSPGHTVHTHRGASPRYRALPITIQHDSPSEYSVSEYSEYSDAESVWSSSSVTSGYSENQTASSTPSASYYSSESQYSSTPSASYYRSEGQNSSRNSYASVTSEPTANPVSRVRIG